MSVVTPALPPVWRRALDGLYHAVAPDAPDVALCDMPLSVTLEPARVANCTKCALGSQPYQALPYIVVNVLPHALPDGDAAYAAQIQVLLAINARLTHIKPWPELYGHGTPAAYARHYGLICRQTTAHDDTDDTDATRWARLTVWGRLYVQWLAQGFGQYTNSQTGLTHQRRWQCLTDVNKRPLPLLHTACGINNCAPPSWNRWRIELQDSTPVTCFRCATTPAPAVSSMFMRPT